MTHPVAIAWGILAVFGILLAVFGGDDDTHD
jgi:hypothetical protein